MILEQSSCRVVQAADGRQALNLARTLRPAVILLNGMLPDISGLEVLEQIRADPTLSGSSVIPFSARATDSEQQARGLDAGADGFIAKPVAGPELVTFLNEACRAMLGREPEEMIGCRCATSSPTSTARATPRCSQRPCGRASLPSTTRRASPRRITAKSC